MSWLAPTRTIKCGGGGSFGDEERVDPAALADERDVGGDGFADGFQKGEIRRAGQVPVLAVADNEVEDVLVRRELDHGRVPDAGGDADDLIGCVYDLQHGRAGRQVGRVVLRRLRLGERRGDPEE